MEDFGGKLRQARERRGISLRQIAASTKIAAAALQALERNDISKLPGGVFSRAFVRSYASEVGLDAEETVREFLERFDQERPPNKETVSARSEHERDFEEPQRTGATATRVGLALIPVLALVLYIVLRRQTGAPPPPRPQHSVQTPPTAAAAPAAEAARAAAGSPARPSDAGAPSHVARTMQLDVHPTADCWISLTIDGRKVLARVLRSGEHATYAVAREAVVEIGDAGAFAYSIDGRPGKSLGDKGRVRTLRLTPATVSQYLK